MKLYNLCRRVRIGQNSLLLFYSNIMARSISPKIIAIILVVLVMQRILLQIGKNETIGLFDFEKLECSKMIANDEGALARGSLFSFNDSEILREIWDSKERCETIQNIFGFFSDALSTEERDFPLAYGMLVHDNFVQIAFLLSAIYQPQNRFCIAIDGNSDESFVKLIDILASCYSNIHYFVTDPIRWCGYEILTSVFKCVEHLVNLNHHWKYFQYLSGVDAPLKTNLEMVRIFKALNGSFNAEINDFEFYRLNGKLPFKSPLPLFKTSLSATFSRKSANFMVEEEIVRKQIEYLRGTECADESLWATIAGNPEILKMPGGFNARAFLREERQRKGRIRNEGSESGLSVVGQVYNVTNYYISRYQQYSNRPPAKCNGYYYRYSCVFGVYDLPNLASRHELIAHKLYFSFQPAAFLCLIGETRRRSLQGSENFTGVEYRAENIMLKPHFI